MELSDLLVETSEVVATYKGREFKMQVFTEKLTPEYKAHLIALTVAVEDAGAAAPAELKDETSQMLADLIESWDVVLNGEPFGPTYDNLLKLSYPLQASLLKQITAFLGDLANPTKETN